MQYKFSKQLWAAAIFACMACPAFATENSVSTPNGADGFLVGALPPAGLYNVMGGTYYSASRFNDGGGNSVLPGFKTRATVLGEKLLYMTNTTVAGGRLGFYGALALVDLHVQLAGHSDSRTGLGDVDTGAMLAWHAGNLHWFAVGSVILPTGAYDKNRLANLGSNYYTFRPQAGFSWVPASGWDVSARVNYSFNSRNEDTDYRSGQYLGADFNIGRAVTKNLKLGFQGYYLHQTTDDKVGGVSAGVNGNRANVLAVGPAVYYQAGHTSVEFKLLREQQVRNRSDGTTGWLKVVWPL